MFTKAWLQNAVHVVLVAFVGAFVGNVAGAGLSISPLTTLHAAAFAGLGAAAAALQALLAAPVSPPTSSTAFFPVAAWQRVQTLARSGPQPVTAADLDAAIDRLAQVLALVRPAASPAAPPPPPAG